MRSIILAAGQGTRLRPYTDETPKAMVHLAGKPLLYHQIDVLKHLGVDDITVIGGYREDKILYPGVKKIINPKFATTNMVYTLFQAHSLFDGKDDVLITYGDVVFMPKVLSSLLSATGHLSLTIDKEWKRFWKLRMDDPLQDAETLKIEQDKIVEIGKKPKSYDEIQGQYMGLIKVSADRAKEFYTTWLNMDHHQKYDGKDYENMYMTSYIQYLINQGWFAKPVYVENGWLEIDSVEDLDLYETMLKDGTLDPFFKPLS